MNIAVENTNGEMIDVNIELYRNKQFVNCCEAENMQGTYARAKNPETKPELAYNHKIIKAFIDPKTRKKFEVSEHEAISICTRSIEQFAENRFKNKQTFFIELMSQSPYDLQYHFLVEE
ncbi:MULTISPECIES: hypothetical protein [unclassified Zunongwangia]|uniref:hypothetical protein n=1 Tax=unclassified Zunongwangia TaxID=2632541 RepID=UPI0022DD66BF|nr:MULTISPECIES: hypothetical protein [unclassified Zunongwangia]WBL22908.1 hypothetical protein PBT89_02865 [Zunongwangia sp. HRR-M8]WBL25181.1 hypothetical protein PBT91_14915 [Zunongwangia sp. HGR-M22]